MNKNRYRIVYNPARGMAMVVADITVSAYALTAPVPPTVAPPLRGRFA